MTGGFFTQPANHAAQSFKYENTVGNGANIGQAQNPYAQPTLQH